MIMKRKAYFEFTGPTTVQVVTPYKSKTVSLAKENIVIDLITLEKHEYNHDEPSYSARDLLFYAKGFKNKNDSSYSFVVFFQDGAADRRIVRSAYKDEITLLFNNKQI
jgi:hypothetical protein